MLDKTGCDKASSFNESLDAECWTKQRVTRPVSLIRLWMQNVHAYISVE